MSQICSKMANFLFQLISAAIFFYHSNGKSQINTRVLNFAAIALINYLKEITEKQLLFSDLKGGPK